MWPRPLPLATLEEIPYPLKGAKQGAFPLLRVNGHVMKSPVLGDACGSRASGLRFATVLPDDGQELRLQPAIALAHGPGMVELPLVPAPLAYPAVGQEDQRNPTAQ